MLFKGEVARGLDTLSYRYARFLDSGYSRYRVHVEVPGLGAQLLLDTPLCS